MMMAKNKEVGVGGQEGELGGSSRRGEMEPNDK